MSDTVQGPTSHAGEPTALELLADDDIIGLLRAAHGRRLEREGIPMFVGLQDERESAQISGDDALAAEGTALAEVFDRYSAALVPWARDDDEDAVIIALQLMAFTHFAPGPQPVADAVASHGLDVEEVRA